MYRNFDIRKIKISAEKSPNSRLHLATPCLSPTFHCLIQILHTEKGRMFYTLLVQTVGRFFLSQTNVHVKVPAFLHMLYRDVHCSLLHIFTLQVNIKLLNQPSRRDEFRLDPPAQSTKGNRKGLFQNKPYKENTFTSRDTENFQLHTSIFSENKHYCHPSCTAYCHQV